MATINDIVLIHLEDTPLSFARIENIVPDHKKDWYQIKLLMLQVPLQVVTWILKDVYINGDEFYMNGKKMQLEKVECPADEAGPTLLKNNEKHQEEEPPQEEEKPENGNTGNIISFPPLKNSRTEKDPDPGPAIG